MNSFFFSFCLFRDKTGQNKYPSFQVEEFFESMDRDFDGRLSFEEFMGEESTIEKLFKNMDKNKDGKVSKQVIKTLKKTTDHDYFCRNLCQSVKT